MIGPTERDTLIADALGRVGDAFEPDFLAYAALAGKIEMELCTALAWRLRRVCDASEIKVVREWRPPNDKRNIDLAVLRDSVPCALIEAKQWRSFNFASWSGGKGQRNPLNHTAKDIDKLRGLSVDCDCFILSFCVHCDPIPSKAYDKEIKYLGETVGFGPIKESQIHDGFERLRHEWGSLPVKARGEIPAGQAFGVNVFVYYWLLKVR